MGLLREYVREELSKILKERNDSISVVARDILTAYPDLLRKGKGERGELRLQPINPGVKLTADEIRDILNRSGHPVDKEAPPGSLDAKSSKFNTYWTVDGVAVVVAGGANKGQKFEREIVSEVGESELTSLKLALKLMGLNSDNIASVESGRATARRPLSIESYDVGSTIADLIFRMKDGSAAYISLKNRDGDTFGNFGIVGAFTEKQPGIITTSAHSSDAVMLAFGIDKERIADSLTKFIAGQGKTVVDSSPLYDAAMARNILESGFGYGYWYCRKHPKDWNIIDLTTKDKLIAYVGDVHVEKVKYPGEDKQCAAWIRTSTGGSYKLEIRNTKGGIVPSEIKIKIRR